MERLIEEYRRRWLEAFDKEWGSMSQPLGWIAVTDQMPMLGQRVMLGNASDQWVTIGERAVTGTYMHWDGDDAEELHEPTHWMPLPAPPSDTTAGRDGR